MKKRQKNKNIKRALGRIGTTDFTKHDKRILKTYGREAFRAEYGFEPEVLDIDAKVVTESAADTWANLRRSFKSLCRSITEAFMRTERD